MTTIIPHAPARPAHAVRAAHLALTDAQYTTWFALAPDGLTPPPLRRTMTRVWESLGSERLADALIRIESTVGISLDADEALACGDVGGLLALVQAKAGRTATAHPLRAERRPGHVEVYDLTAYRAAVERPIRADRFARWLAPQPAPAADPPSLADEEAVRETLAAESPAAPPGPVAQAAADAPPPPAPPPGRHARQDYLMAAAKAVLVVIAFSLASQWLNAAIQAPPDTLAQAALREAVR